MKLSELIPHTSEWLGIPQTTVSSVARELRPAGLLSSGGRGPGGAEMTVDDKINLLLGVCGVEIAKRAAEHVRVWRDLVRYGVETEHPFQFTRAKTVKDFFVSLITGDLNGGPLDVWLKEADAAYEKAKAPKAAPRHKITLDFFVDEFAFTIVVSRFVGSFDDRFPTLRQSAGDTIEVSFRQAPPIRGNTYVVPKPEKSFQAPSRLIRRLDAANIRGWGTCLLEQ